MRLEGASERIKEMNLPAAGSLLHYRCYRHPADWGSSNCNLMESYPQTKSKGIEGDVIAAEWEEKVVPGSGMILKTR